jgi:hypothetical protein
MLEASPPKGFPSKSVSSPFRWPPNPHYVD